MPTRKELIKEAKGLGLETKGTSHQLAERIAQKLAEDDKEEIPKAELVAKVVEPVKEPEVKKPEVKEPEAKPVKAPAMSKEKKVSEVPRAIPTADVTQQVTAIATKTCVKFNAGWRKLVKGKPITAPRSVIADLRRGGLVE